jgi:hypothetical protein
MTCGSKQWFFILLSVFGIFLFDSPAQAQTCTPTVYLFRHAEDEATKVALTEAGKKHAVLYPEMLLQYQITSSDCPVKRVLAMYDHNPDATPGTTNPRDTAEPLAKQCCGGNVEMSLIDRASKKYFLYEKINSSPDGGLASDGFGRLARIFYALQPTLNSESSVAIFWTQEGLPDVSQALNVPPIYIPRNVAPPADPALSWPGRLRSSVNKFSWTGNSYVAQYNYSVQQPPTKRTDISPAQCWTQASTKYDCSNSGILDYVPQKGKFCVDFFPDSGINYAYCL